jgi:hypothetical protein
MNTISYIIKTATQPLPEIRLAAYDVLRAIKDQDTQRARYALRRQTKDGFSTQPRNED